MDISFEVILILLLILANGAFSLSEMAIVSARRPRMARLASKGSHGAQAALKLSQNPNDFLSTVQIGITLVSTLAGAYGGATIAEQASPFVAQWPYIGPYAESASLSAVVLVITFLSLVIGELVPKRIALSKPERIAIYTAPAMHFLSRAARPAVALLGVSTNLVLKLIPGKEASEPAVTEEEIRHMVAHGAEIGVFHKAEHEMVEGVFRLGDRVAIDLMTPRGKLLWIDLDQPLESALGVIESCSYSRFLAGRRSLDRVVGYLEARDLTGSALRKQPIDLTKLLRQPIFVPEAYPAVRLIDSFRKARVPLAVVVGESGQTMGIVTPTDLLEAIVGDLPLPHEEHDAKIVRREDGSYLVDGLLSIADLESLLGIDDLGDAANYYNTLGGFIMHTLERMPETGDRFIAHNHIFEVVDMDNQRVDRVLVTPQQPESTP